MPLIEGKSKKSFEKNFLTEKHAGKPMKQSLAIAYSMKRKAQKKAMGGAMESGYLPEPEEPEMHNAAAMMEDDKRLNQRMAEGGEVYSSIDDPSDEEVNMTPESEGAPVHVRPSPDPEKYGPAFAMGGDVVDRIMKKKYSEGGKIANGGDDDLDQMADGRRNNFDDLALRDDLDFNYTGANSGDLLGDTQEDHDRHDIVARIMRKRAKQHNPVPA